MAVAFIFASSLIAISSQSVFSTDLQKGKNLIYINLSEPVYAETIVKLNPEIEVISYTEGNQTFGYVNVFQGIGENFAVEEREYEIIVSKDTGLVLPD
jgi:hypothetical protein